jgi:purine catabolism regulator
VTDQLAAHVRRRLPVVVAAGSPVARLDVAHRTLHEAVHVLASTAGRRAPEGVVRLEDVHVRGLLTLLADDQRLRAFAERELAPLRERTDRSSPDLLRVLEVVIEHWDRKSRAAELLNLSRPVLYDRIARVERLLGVSLADAEVRTSLHVALLAEAVAGPD